MSSILGAVKYHPDNQEREHFQWVQGIDISVKINHKIRQITMVTKPNCKDLVFVL